jgi:hypothetical protein
MIHQLSRATSYLTTYFVHPISGELVPRSRATGFFIRVENAVLLVTNWHVVTGLNPADPSLARDPAPHLLKAMVASKDGMLTELSLPLYNPELVPLWEEHPDGPKVDVAIYPLRLGLEKHFHFVDIASAEDDVDIKEMIAKDVFILGYPFSRDEMKEGFGEDAPFYLPVWKRGTIASEPTVQLGKRRLLIDSLSRPGMSGSPVMIAEDANLLVARSAKDADILRRVEAGDFGAVLEMDRKVIAGETVKQFRFLGVYSGVIGKSRLAEVALGVCWHADTLLELLAKARGGVMPFHAPEMTKHLADFLATFPGSGELIRKDISGQVIEHSVIPK